MINASNVCSNMLKETMLGKKVAVLGLGVSNFPALNYLYKCGAIVSAYDRSSAERLGKKVVDRVKKICRDYYFGEDYLDHIGEADYILRSPGIKPFEPQLTEAKKRGTVVTSEMELFMLCCPCKIIAVTGSDGKTTTTTIIYELLSESKYNCYVGGNIGTPLLDRLDEITKDDMVVLELSSFQLMDMGVSPDVAVITNISPNHLDYHRDMAEYVEAKTQIFKNQKEHGRLILNSDNAVTVSLAKDRTMKTEYFSRLQKTNGAYLDGDYLCCNGERIIRADEIKIPGGHNVENYLAAITAVRPYVSVEAIRKVARTFNGVEHRMEYVRKVGGVEFYNDSIGSSPTRTIAGLEAHHDNVVLIAGGYDKNLDYGELGVAIKKYTKGLVLVGATSEKIKAAVLKAYGSDKCTIPIVMEKKYEDAVNAAYLLAQNYVRKNENVSVVLSPASASFDMFKNFMERGEKFKSIVNDLQEE